MRSCPGGPEGQQAAPAPRHHRAFGSCAPSHDAFGDDREGVRAGGWDRRCSQTRSCFQEGFPPGAAGGSEPHHVLAGWPGRAERAGRELQMRVKNQGKSAAQLSAVTQIGYPGAKENPAPIQVWGFFLMAGKLFHVASVVTSQLIQGMPSLLGKSRYSQITYLSSLPMRKTRFSCTEQG